MFFPSTKNLKTNLYLHLYSSLYSIYLHIHCTVPLAVLASVQVMDNAKASCQIHHQESVAPSVEKNTSQTYRWHPLVAQLCNLVSCPIF